MITAAGLIMILVFLSFSLINNALVIQEFGIGFAVAIVIDAFVVRTVLVPSLMHLLGARTGGSVVARPPCCRSCTSRPTTWWEAGQGARVGVTTQGAGNVPPDVLERPRRTGRGVVVANGQAPPQPWSDCPRIPIGERDLRGPGPAAEALHEAWIGRRPVVVDLGVDPGASCGHPSPRPHPCTGSPPVSSSPASACSTWCGATTTTPGGAEPVWWHGRKAARMFAATGVGAGGPGDIVLGDGTPLFVDGGPFAPPAQVGGIGVVHRWNLEAQSLDPVGTPRPPRCSPRPRPARRGGAPRRRRTGDRPAGSGKTRVLTERIRHLIADCHVHPALVRARLQRQGGRGDAGALW